MIDRSVNTTGPGTFQDFLDRYFSDKIKDSWTFLKIFTAGSLLANNICPKILRHMLFEILSCRWMQGLLHRRLHWLSEILFTRLHLLYNDHCSVILLVEFFVHSNSFLFLVTVH
jgi:hypothetical protein